MSETLEAIARAEANITEIRTLCDSLDDAYRNRRITAVAHFVAVASLHAAHTAALRMLWPKDRTTINP